MNDRYLFKAKRKNQEELPKEEQWVQGYYVQRFNDSKEPIHIIFDPITVFEVEGWEIDPTTLCQCTGLKDKGGNLIWENDIVLTPGEEGYSVILWAITEAKWVMSNEAEGLIMDFDCYWSNEIEVCGNRFDNPELLEVEHDRE